MADESESRAVIEKLKAETPVMPTRSRKHQMLDVARNICAAIAIVAIAIALYSNSKSTAAAKQSAVVGQCVNDRLAQRNGPVARDTQAHLDFATLLSRLVSMSKEQQKAEAAQIRAQIRAYADTLKRDQAERAASPLGQC